MYLSTLESKLKRDGLARAFYVVASNSGVMTAETAIRHASATLLSGPAAGAVGGIFFAELLGRGNLITMDMGGTSFDVTLVSEGQVSLSTEGSVAGYRIAKPMCDIHTIGAGGGSIAWIDAGGMLKVGPASAGSDPGPVCYDLGGENPTVTDANLLLGYLDKDFFLGGEMKVNEPKARAAMKQRHRRAARACPRWRLRRGSSAIINQNMADATKVVSVQRGHDPREFALVSAGRRLLDARLQDRRGGRLHGGHRAPGGQRVLRPGHAGVRHPPGQPEDLSTRLIPGIDLAEFNAVIAETEKKALAELLQEGVERGRASLVRHLDMRYVGQHHEVSVEIPSACRIEEKHLTVIAEAFHRAHEKLYTYSTPENPLEIMNLRITAVGAVDKTGPVRETAGHGGSREGAEGKAQGALRGAGRPGRGARVQQGPPGAGKRIPGPAIIEERITTIVVHPGWDARVDGFENVVMEARRAHEGVRGGARPHHPRGDLQPPPHDQPGDGDHDDQHLHLAPSSPRCTTSPARSATGPTGSSRRSTGSPRTPPRSWRLPRRSAGSSARTSTRGTCSC